MASLKDMRVRIAATKATQKITKAMQMVAASKMRKAQQAALADIVGRERNGGPALATFQMSADSGAIVGPILAGLLIDHGSYPLAYGTLVDARGTARHLDATAFEVQPVITAAVVAASARI